MTSFFSIGSSKTPRTPKIIHKFTEGVQTVRDLCAVPSGGKQAVSVRQCSKLPGPCNGQWLFLASRTMPGTLGQDISDVDVDQIGMGIFRSAGRHEPGSTRQIGIL